MNEEKIEVSKKDLGFLLDQANAYMGTYEGGTIQREENDILRRVAELLGFNPMEYTSLSYTDEYKHEPVMEGSTRRRLDGTWYSHYRCKWCFKEEDHEVHKTEGA